MGGYLTSNLSTEELVRNAIQLHESVDKSRIIVAIPHKIGDEFIRELLEDIKVSGVILSDKNYETDFHKYASRIGNFIPDKYIWRFPQQKADAVIFIGSGEIISYRMVLVALVHHCYSLTYLSDGKWKNENGISFIGKHFRERLKELLARIIRSLFFSLKKFVKTAIPIADRFLYKLGLINHPGAVEVWVYRMLPVLKRKIEDVYLRKQSKYLFEKLIFTPDVPLFPASYFENERILLVNNALAWGGAERQIVNTLLGLKQAGYNDVALICERLFDFDESDFYL